MSERYEYYELPCKRIFNLLHMKIYKLVLTFFIIVIASVIMFYVRTSDSVDLTAVLIVGIIFGVIYGIVMIISKFLSFPKCIDVNKTTVKFEVKQSLIDLLSHKSYDPIGDKHYSIYNIEKIKFYQTPFEKKKNVCSIEFKGRILIVDDMNNILRGDEPGTMTVHGIADFKDMSNWIYNHLESKEAIAENEIAH